MVAVIVTEPPFSEKLAALLSHETTGASSSIILTEATEFAAS